MTLFESLHADDIKVLGSAIRTECQKCREKGTKRCLHQPILISIDRAKVNARNTADILRNIAGSGQC